MATGIHIAFLCGFAVAQAGAVTRNTMPRPRPQSQNTLMASLTAGQICTIPGPQNAQVSPTKLGILTFYNPSLYRVWVY